MVAYGDPNYQAVHRIGSTVFVKQKSFISCSKFSTPDCQHVKAGRDGCQVVV
jgi:hypothetical protein